MKRILILIMLMFSLASCDNNQSNQLLPNEEVIEENSLFYQYLKLGNRLQDVLSIDPATFAAASMIVHYSESGFQYGVIGDNFSMGICQLTIGTRKALGIPNDISKASTEQQLIYYERFLRACSKKALRSIKNSVDLHAVHFAPSRATNKILSKVSNRNLKALDRDGDGSITKKDLYLFEKHRLKESRQMTNIYDQFFNTYYVGKTL